MDFLLIRAGMFLWKRWKSAVHARWAMFSASEDDHECTFIEIALTFWLSRT